MNASKCTYRNSDEDMYDETKLVSGGDNVGHFLWSEEMPTYMATHKRRENIHNLLLARTDLYRHLGRSKGENVRSVCDGGQLGHGKRMVLWLYFPLET